MHKVIFENKTLFVSDGTRLSSVLTNVDHPCGKKGICKKCSVLVNGKRELSCQYIIHGDITVTYLSEGAISSPAGTAENGFEDENMIFCLDIGTTTVALALINGKGEVVKLSTKTNPQRTFGADVLSRIEYVRNGGINELCDAIISLVNSMCRDIKASLFSDKKYDMYISGNTTMLHLFFKEDCSKMGESPYTPAFLSEKETTGEAIGLTEVQKAFSLPSVSAFVGSDIVAGLNLAKMPPKGKYNLFIDLGTNAEIVLFSPKRAICTSAAAGPCFEGVNISSGMSAREGAVYSVNNEGFSVIGNTTPEGICATGLIDIIALLLDKGIIDSTGYMEKGEYKIAEGVSLLQEDIRQYQLASSAVLSAILTLVKRENASLEDIDTLYISGGFSDKLNVENAVRAKLIPPMLKDKVISLNNSSLLGTIKYAMEKNDLSFFSSMEYIDLSSDEYFYNLFIENMSFDGGIL